MPKWLEFKKKTQGRNLKCQIFIQHFFKIVLHWCLDLICHNVGTSLKHNKYIFDIPIPFCHNINLSATFKQFLTEFVGSEIHFHFVYMWVRMKFLRAIWLVNSTNQIEYARQLGPLKTRNIASRTVVQDYSDRLLRQLGSYWEE